MCAEIPGNHGPRSRYFTFDAQQGPAGATSLTQHGARSRTPTFSSPRFRTPSKPPRRVTRAAAAPPSLTDLLASCQDPQIPATIILSKLDQAYKLHPTFEEKHIIAGIFTTLESRLSTDDDRQQYLALSSRIIGAFLTNANDIDTIKTTLLVVKDPSGLRLLMEAYTHTSPQQEWDIFSALLIQRCIAMRETLQARPPDALRLLKLASQIAKTPEQQSFIAQTCFKLGQDLKDNDTAIRILGEVERLQASFSDGDRLTSTLHLPDPIPPHLQTILNRIDRLQDCETDKFPRLLSRVSSLIINLPDQHEQTCMAAHLIQMTTEQALCYMGEPFLRLSFNILPNANHATQIMEACLGKTLDDQSLPAARHINAALMRTAKQTLDPSQEIPLPPVISDNPLPLQPSKPPQNIAPQINKALAMQSLESLQAIIEKQDPQALLPHAQHIISFCTTKATDPQTSISDASNALKIAGELLRKSDQLGGYIDQITEAYLMVGRLNRLETSSFYLRARGMGEALAQSEYRNTLLPLSAEDITEINETLIAAVNASLDEEPSELFGQAYRTLSSHKSSSLDEVFFSRFIARGDITTPLYFQGISLLKDLHLDPAAFVDTIVDDHFAQLSDQDSLAAYSLNRILIQIVNSFQQTTSTKLQLAHAHLFQARRAKKNKTAPLNNAAQSLNECVRIVRSIDPTTLNEADKKNLAHLKYSLGKYFFKEGKNATAVLALDDALALSDRSNLSHIIKVYLNAAARAKDDEIADGLFRNACELLLSPKEKDRYSSNIHAAYQARMGISFQR